MQQSVYDVFKVSGVPTLGGTLRLVRSGDYLPDAGGTFTVLECANRIGRFEQIELVGFPKSTRVGVKYDPNSVVVAFSFPAP